MKNCFKCTVCLILIFIITSSLYSQNILIKESVEEKIDSLLTEMTLEEKVGQLVQLSYWDHKPEEIQFLIRQGKLGSMLNVPPEISVELQKIAVTESHMKIPLLYGLDVIHGLRTIFPIPLAEAASWNLMLIEKSAEIAAREAKALGIHWTFAPMVDIARDPRWGRIAEGAGEDPFLGQQIAAARVRGFQGDDFSDSTRIIACAKHYAGYGAGEGGREYNTVDMSIRTLHDIHLPPFHAAVNAGVGSIMCAFVDLNGIPATANSYILDKVLRQRWSFQGFVVSDWNSIAELMNHGIVGNPEEAGLMSIAAGVDMDMEGEVYHNHLAKIVEQQMIPESLIDQSVRRVLRLKILAGLFENPHTDLSRAEKVVLCQDHIDYAREMAKESIVLLKNTNGILPLKKDISKITVVGPLADSQRDPLGCWAAFGNPKDVISVLTGIEEKVDKHTEILFTQGCGLEKSDKTAFDHAIQLAKEGDVVIAVLGESARMSGEGYSRADIGLPGQQLNLLKKLKQTNKPLILVLMAGRPLAIPWAAEHVDAILVTWQLGVQHGNGVADILFGDSNPGGKLPVTFPRATGQIPIHYNHLNTGRPSQNGVRHTMGYGDLTIEPLFPFGYGLSYTQFQYTDLKLNNQEIKFEESLTVTVRVMNSGNRVGNEVVQLYIRDLVASVTQPVKSLKGFQRIALDPGETKTVTFGLESKQLGFHNTEGDYVIEPGEFKLWVGPNSQEGLETTFHLKK